MRVFVYLTLYAIIFAVLPMRIVSQAPAVASSFEKIEMFESIGTSVREQDVRVTFADGKLQILSRKNNSVLRDWPYDTIRSAEYSYTKKPRWKTGLGLGAASVLFPPLMLIALPIGFTKHRRHWITIRTENDFALLKLSKSNRKLFIPTLETRSGVHVIGLGDDK